MAKRATRLLVPDWESLYAQYNQPAFIADDPISLPHAYQNHADWRATELVAFLAAMLSYGRRASILTTLRDLLARLDDTPLEALQQLDARQLKRRFRGFYYRFNTADDMRVLCLAVQEAYATHGSLKGLWQACYADAEARLPEAISRFRGRLLSGHGDSADWSNGLRFLLADPMQGSAAKRFNMFLRWMVRQDAVDLGLWADVMPASVLHFPLDTHVATMARRYGITQRQSNDWKTVAEITRYFQAFCPEDPVRYDFALFGLGIEEAAAGQKQAP